MHKRISKYLFALLCVTLWWTVSANAADPTSLTFVDPESGAPNIITVLNGDPIAVQIRVDDASVVAGASFTVNFASALTPRSSDPVSSDFFDTFYGQGLLGTPEEFVTVTGDTKEYYSPIVDNTSPGSIMLAAARVSNGSGTDVPILTVHFDAMTTAGDYSVSIIQSTINNEDAGYDPAGELIPYLVGINGTDYPAFSTITSSSATITVLAFLDSENGGAGDGIDDTWELLYVTTVDELTATGDRDGDGYSDLQEYLNRNELDPDGNPYNPLVKNAADGTGYNPPTQTPVVIPAINLLLLGD